MTTSTQAHERLRELEGHSGVYHAPRISNAAGFHAFCNDKRHGQETIDLAMLPTDAFAKIQNTIREGKGSDGGYLIDSTDIMEVTESNRVQASPMRKVCRIERVGPREAKFPQITDSGVEGRIITADAPAQTTDPSFQAGAAQGFDYSSDLVKVSNTLLLNAAAKLTIPLFAVMARRIGRRQNRSFTIGDTGNEPGGIVHGCDFGKTTASSTAINIDEVIDLVASVDAEYDDGAVFMCHKLVAAALFKLVDGQGSYLWQASGLSKIPIVPNRHMSSALTTGKIPLLYGNFASAYTITDYSSNLQIMRTRFATTNQTAFHQIDRSDGHMADSAAVKKLVLA